MLENMFLQHGETSGSASSNVSDVISGFEPEETREARRNTWSELLWKENRGGFWHATFWNELCKSICFSNWSRAARTPWRFTMCLFHWSYQQRQCRSGLIERRIEELQVFLELYGHSGFHLQDCCVKKQLRPVWRIYLIISVCEVPLVFTGFLMLYTCKERERRKLIFQVRKFCRRILTLSMWTDDDDRTRIWKVWLKILITAPSDEQSPKCVSCCMMESVASLRGAWVGHGPPRFFLAPPPVFFLISRLSSFGWHM